MILDKLDQRIQLLFLIVKLHRREMQVVAEDVHRHDARAHRRCTILCQPIAILIANVIDNFVANARRCCRRHCQCGGGAQFQPRFLNKEIIGPEIVTPEADTVRFVDDKEINPGAAKGAQELPLTQPFGRRVDQLVTARRNGLHALG